jgi:2-iminobutanoate/2-iminopropanoate deaminase
MNQEIHTNQAPAAVGPYSQAIQTGSLLFISGQIPLDPATGKLVSEQEGDVREQTRQVLTNLKHILEEAGADMKDVVKTTVLMADIRDFEAMNGVYAEFFTEPYPARAAFQVAALPKGAKVEVEAVASLA